MLKEISQCISAMNTLYFGQFSSSITLLLPFPSYPTIQQLSEYSYITTCTDAMNFNIVDITTFAL
jgi:hypothetical protein